MGGVILVMPITFTMACRGAEVRSAINQRHEAYYMPIKLDTEWVWLYSIVPCDTQLQSGDWKASYT